MTQARIERMLEDVRITSYGKIVVLTAAAALAAVVVTVTSLTSTELTARETETAALPGSGFVYFPSLHVIQAAGTEEHIQAF